jgi:hypothetical protein
MKKIRLRVIWFFGLLPLVGQAIITSNNTIAATDPFGSNGFNWDYVYNYKNSSAVAVDPYWILTAAHVADDAGTGSLLIGGVTYSQQEIIYHGTADLALVRYDQALPGYYSLYTGELVPKNPNNKLSVVMVGFGTTGTVSSSSWTDSGSGRGTKRWGTQKIDSSETVAYNAGGVVGITTNIGVWMDFTLGNTANEAGVGVYDSGGGTFYNDNGTWKVAGINTLRADGPNYTSSYSISTGAYESWIGQVIPEPTTGVLLAGIAVVFGIIKRMRYMYQ